MSSGALIHLHFRALAGKWNSIQMAVNANLKLKAKGFVGKCWLLWIPEVSLSLGTAKNEAMQVCKPALQTGSN